MAVEEGGADIIEIGIPFSDPVADGPVIQATSDAALRGGMTAEGRARPGGGGPLHASKMPIVLMGYYNPIFRMGESEFMAKAAHKGADGLIVPDLPMEEARHLRQCSIREGMDLIQLVAPTTPDDRMREIASASSGYLYLVSRLGSPVPGPPPRPTWPSWCGGPERARGLCPLRRALAYPRQSRWSNCASTARMGRSSGAPY